MRLVDRIRKIPGDEGFWKSSAEEAFIEAGMDMRLAGMEGDKIVEVLTSLYYAVAECYGD